MQTFAVHLHQNQTLNLANQVFQELALHGINPSRFVEWYAADGIDAAPQQSIQWLKDELILNENMLGRGIGNTLGSAWRLGSQGMRSGWNAMKQVPGMVKDTASSAADTLGRHVDKAAGKQGIQYNPMSPSKYYNVATGHYVRGQNDPTPIDRLGNPIPAHLAKRPGPIDDVNAIPTPRNNYDDYDDYQPRRRATPPPLPQKTKATPPPLPQNNTAQPGAPTVVQSAMTALSNLSKVLLTSKVKQNPLTQNQKLIQSLNYLLGALRNMPAPQPQQQTQQTQQTQQQTQQQPQQAPSAYPDNTGRALDHGEDATSDHYEADGISLIEQEFLELKIKQINEALEEDNLDSRLILEFTQGVRDWWGRVKRRFSNAWSGWQSGGHDYDVDQENQQINQTVQQVTQALQGLQQYANTNGMDEDIKSQIDAVLKHLQPQQETPQENVPLPEEPPATEHHEFMQSILRTTSSKTRPRNSTSGF